MKNYTDITVILDKSGSMQSVLQDTIGGYNNFIKKQREVPSSKLSLMTFSDKPGWVYGSWNITDAQLLSEATYIPGGNTALYDAIGKAINEKGEQFRSLPEHERPNKVVFVIITDGHENASREFRASHLKEMIEHQQEKYNWQFIYLGADQDAILSSQRIGLSGVATMSYSNSSAGIMDMLNVVAGNVSAYAAGTKVDMSFTPEQKLKAADIMVKEGKVKPTC